MHPSAYAHMAQCIERYLVKDRRYTVLDFGSHPSGKQTTTHRDLLTDYDCHITGADIKSGSNVDAVMKKPYRLPMKSNSFDLVVSGQVFEHIPFFWASMLEIARVLKPAAYFFMTVPSRGHVHTAVDCWRYYPDGVRAMAAFAGLDLREVHTDFPPVRRGKFHDYKQIEVPGHYWGDTVGVFQKPASYPRARLFLVRSVVTWWANQLKLAPTPHPGSSSCSLELIHQPLT